MPFNLLMIKYSGPTSLFASLPDSRGTLNNTGVQDQGVTYCSAHCKNGKWLRFSQTDMDVGTVPSVSRISLL